MNKIFVCINKDFGEWTMLEYNDRDIANTVWEGLNDDGIITITVKDNQFRVHNAKQTHQPQKVNSKEWPAKALEEYESGRINHEYLGASVVDHDFIGLFEMKQRWHSERTGLTKTKRTFMTYAGNVLFSVKSYD